MLVSFLANHIPTSRVPIKSLQSVAGVKQQRMPKRCNAIGIDLGTTYSCVGVWQNEHVEIIANEQGSRTTPSYVAFTEKGRLIGDAAMNPENTVFDAKRLVGRHFSDVEEDMKHWPLKVVKKDTKPFIQIQFKGETKTFSPEEISSMVLL